MSSRRLTFVALVTSGLYLSGVLFTSTLAYAQPLPAHPTPRPGEPGGLGSSPPGTQPPTVSPLRPTDVRTPQAPPDAGGTLLEEVLDPNAYVVGPGDLLALNYWGAQNFSYSLRIDPQGRLYIPNVGFVPARGMTLAALEKAVTERVRVVYPRLKHGLTLLQPRVFLVHVTGLVKEPDLYSVTALTRVGNLVKQAGGRLPGGSMRLIEVRRGGKTLIADLQRYNATADRSANPQLLEGDVVHVPAAVLAVSVEGAVRRGGSYELRAGDLAELLDAAGGLSRDASRELKVLVYRRQSGDRVELLELGVAAVVATQRTRLRDGDVVVIPGASNTQRKILVQGAIAAGTEPAAAAAASDRRMDSSGAGAREAFVAITYNEGDTVRSAIERAGGLLPWADARNTVVERREPSGKTVKLPVDAHALLVLRDLTKDLPVRPGDSIYVPSARESVMVSGPVHRPGLYMFNPRYSAQDYIYLAGGPTPAGAVPGSKVIKKDGTAAKVDAALKVSPGDTIAVKQRALTTAEWISVLLTATSIVLSGTAIAVSLTR